MTIQLVKKPPIGKKWDALRIVLEGNHTLEEKACMMRQAKYFLMHDCNIGNAGMTNVYMPLVDLWGHPLTRFPNGDEIADFVLKIDSPYPCAADAYDRSRTTFPRLHS